MTANIVTASRLRRRPNKSIILRIQVQIFGGHFFMVSSGGNRKSDSNRIFYIYVYDFESIEMYILLLGTKPNGSHTHTHTSLVTHIYDVLIPSFRSEKP